MQDSAGAIFPQLEAHYLKARRQGFPAFVEKIEASNPLNATPYVVALSQFVGETWMDSRRVMVDSLAAAIAQLRGAGLGVELLLVGGSFLDPRKSPRDLDCVIFYSRPSEPSIDLAAWQEAQHAHGLDVRLLPIDIDPVMVLKMALFFGVLYTRGRESQAQLRGLVLVDCSK